MPKKPSSSQPATSAAPVTVHTLENGFEVLVRPEPSHPVVSVQVWVRVGSIHEEGWTGAGLAHLCEHMLFKGTPTRTAQQLSQQIQELGGSVNAYTSFNRTVYYIDGLAENAEGYMELLADMVQRPKLDPEELLREMDVIRREMAMDHDDPGSTLQHLLQATAFRTHPLRHPIIGHRQVFDAVQHADLAAFVKRHYSPSNCFLVVTGAVQAKAVIAAAERLFGAWQRQPYAPVLLPAEPAQRSARRGQKSFATDITRLAVGWHIPGEAHEHKAAIDVLAFLLGSGRSSRLSAELKEKRGIAHSVWAGSWSGAECGLLSMDAECEPAKAAECLTAMHDVMAKLQAKGPTAAELDKAVRSTIAHQWRSQATTRGLAASLGGGWLTSASTDSSQRYLARVKALTPQQIQAVAKLYCTEANSSTVRVDPQSEQLSAEQESQAITSLQTERVVLKNGLTLLLGYQPRLPLVSIRLGFMAGVLSETEKNAGLSRMAASLLTKGTRTRTAADISSTLESRGGHLIASGDAHRLLLGADVVAGDEGLSLSLLADLLKEPKLAADQLAIVQRQQVASIREELEDPLTVALRRARKVLFAGTAFERTALGSEASVKSATPAAIRTHLKEHVQAGNGVVSVFGAFDPKTIRKQIETAFGHLPKGKRKFTEQRQLPSNVQPQELSVQMEKEQAVLVVGFRTVGLHDADSYVLSMIDEACSDMGSRLFNRIREELGLAYYVGAQNFMAYGAGAFYFYVGTDPKKVALAQKELMKLIADLAKNGLQPAELERAKTTWKARWLAGQQGNAAMADYLGWDELNGKGIEHFHQLPSIISAISVADTKRVAAQFLQRKSAVIVTVLPEKGFVSP